MSTKSLSINPASGADSTQAQEPEVKSFSSSSSNLNNVEVDVDEVEEFDLSLYALKGFNGNPAVYVCTYGKYNSGSLRGAWIDLTAFAD